MADAKKKKGRRTPTGKEVAVVVVSVIMVISILLPSFSQIFATQSTSSQYPTSFDDAATRYQPQVDQAKQAVDANPDDKAAELKLAQASYEWGMYAQAYAGNDDEVDEANNLFTEASNAYGRYLDLEGSLDSDEAKDAAVDRALCQYYAGDTDKCIEQLKTLADETNYASAWANLGMMYENQGNTQEAMTAFQKCIEADPDNKAGLKSYSESQLSSLRSSAAESSGGAQALTQKLEGSES